MSDIPDDVGVTASRIAFDYLNGFEPEASLVDAIARAIMAEREKCRTKIAEAVLVERSRCVASARVLGYGGCGNDVADRLEKGQ